MTRVGEERLLKIRFFFWRIVRDVERFVLLMWIAVLTFVIYTGWHTRDLLIPYIAAANLLAAVNGLPVLHWCSLVRAFRLDRDYASVGWTDQMVDACPNLLRHVDCAAVTRNDLVYWRRRGAV